MNRQDRNIEDLFRTLFEQFTVNPTPGLWKKVQAKIVWKQFLSYSLNSFNIYYLSLFMLLAGSGAYFILAHREQAEITFSTENTPPVNDILQPPAPDPGITSEGPGQASSKHLLVATSPPERKAKLKASPDPAVKQAAPADIKIPIQQAAIEKERSGPAEPLAKKTSLSGLAPSAETAELSVLPDFKASPMSGCSPLAVKFQNLSANAVSMTWNFGDGGFSAESDPSYVFDEAGEFLVTLKVLGKNGLEYTRQQKVRVYQTPKALFEFDEDVKPSVNQPIYFYNYSRGGDHYEWDFGDNQRSSQQEPIHIYQGPGNYHVKLKVWTDHQCYDSLVIYNAFTTQEQRLKVPNAFTPNLNGPTGGYYDVNDLSNTVFHPVIQGELYEFQLRVFNRKGVLLFESNEIGIGWDGYYKEQLMKQDVYIWKIRGKFSNGKTFVESGDVTLIKQY